MHSYVHIQTTPNILLLYILIRRKYVNAQGNKIYWDARYVSAYFDVTPKALTDINRILKLDEIVIRSHTIRVPSAVQKCDSKRYDNPYINAKPN